MTMRTPLLLAALGATLVLGSTGGAVAGAMITGAQIKNGSITSADVRNGSLRSKDLGEAARAELRGATGPAGAVGPAGAQGQAGAAGPSASDFADATSPYGTPLNSFGGSSAATSVASQTITVSTRSRIVATGTGSFGPDGGTESSVECTVRLRPEGGADSTEVAIGSAQSDLETKVGSSGVYTNVTALGSATRGPGSYTVHLRCSDSLSQPAVLGRASLAIVATGDAG